MLCHTDANIDMLHQLIEEIETDRKAIMTPEGMDAVLSHRTFSSTDHLALDSIPETSTLNFDECDKSASLNDGSVVLGDVDIELLETKVEMSGDDLGTSTKDDAVGDNLIENETDSRRSSLSEWL